jgi:hypothetical protein
MATNQFSTYRVVIAPTGYGPDDEFANRFLLRRVDVRAKNRDDAIMRAAIRSGVAEFDCGGVTVRSVEIVNEES